MTTGAHTESTKKVVSFLPLKITFKCVYSDELHHEKNDDNDHEKNDDNDDDDDNDDNDNAHKMKF